MNNSEFFQAVSRLEIAFGKVMPDTQKDLWFEKLRPWSRYKLSKVFENIIDEHDRFPVLATVIKKGSEFIDHNPKIERKPCDLCDGAAMITAVKDGYRTAFRCPVCRNWEGRYSEKIPIWETKWRDAGYRLQSEDLLKGFDPDDPLQKKGLGLLKSVCPAIYLRIIGKHPECAVEGSEHESDTQKEAIRKRSLEQDKARDVESEAR